MTYDGYKNKESRKEYLKEYLREYRKRKKKEAKVGLIQTKKLLQALTFVLKKQHEIIQKMQLPDNAEDVIVLIQNVTDMHTKLEEISIHV